MGNAGAIFMAGFGGANLELPIEGDGIAVHDFSAKALGDGQRERRLARAGRANQRH